MRIRMGQYSLTIGELIVGAIAAYTIVFGISWLGWIGFIGLLMLLVGVAMSVRVAAFWLTYDGPLVGEPIRDSIVSGSLLLVSIILLFV